MDEKTAPVGQTPATPVTPPPAPAPADTKPAEPAVVATSGTTPPTSTEVPVPGKKSSPMGKIVIALFILVDLAIAGYIIFRMMGPQG